MSDPLRKPVSGELFKPSVRREAMYIEAVQRVQALTSGQAVSGELDAGIVLVRNDTGGDLTADHPIVGLGTPLITPADSDEVVFKRPCFSGSTPGTDGRFAVLFSPAKAGAIVTAVASGVVWVRVDVVDGDHEHCTVDGDPTALVSASSGSGFMLWRAGGIGVQWALVRISNPGGVGEEFPPSSGSGSGSGDGCQNHINGVPLSSIPSVAADQIDFVLGINSDGCLVRVSVGDCAEGGGSGS